MVKEIEVQIKEKWEARDDKFLFWLEKTHRLFLYLLIFLLPLFFLPWTVDLLDFNKQLLFLFLVLLSTLAWVIKGFLRGVIRIKWTFVYIPLTFLLLIGFLASLFSLYSYGSFWGWPLKINQAFFSLLGWVLFFFLFLNTFEKKEEIFLAFFIFLSSCFFLTLFGILQIFGKFIFPWTFTKNNNFNTIGTPNAWAIFLAIILPCLVTFLCFVRGYLKWFLGAYCFLALFSLFLVNFWIAWILLALGMTGILAFWIYGGERKKRTWIILPIFLLAIALFFVIFKFPIRGLPLLNIEISPSFSHTFEIAKKVLKEKAIFGSGPGTFGYDFSRYRSPNLSQTIFWNLRFNAGASEILERLATFGILGIGALLALMGSLLWEGFKILLGGLRKEESERKVSLHRLMNLGILSSFLVALASFFLYSSNLSLEFLFWFLGAGLLSLDRGRVRIWKLAPAKIQSIFFSFCLIFTIILILVIFIGGAQRYLGQVYYSQGIRALGRGEVHLAFAKVLRATQLTPAVDVYWRDLSQLAMRRMNEELGRRDLPQEKLSQRVQVFFSLAVNSAKKATDVAPNNVANWQTRGFIYRNSIGLARGAFEWAIKSYEKAKTLEPTNPFIYLEIARTYITQATIMQQLQKKEAMKENLRMAKENLKKAIALKHDYWPAHFQEAILFDLEGRLDEAIQKLEEIKPFAQQDPGLAFQLGSLYWRKEDIKNAKREFERAVQLSPDFANARYFLGLIYDKEGNKEKAIEEFEQIASYSRENERQVAEILENLRQGKPALGEEIEVPPEPEEIPALEEKESKERREEER